ncbi:DinB family protein [Longimicrobium terrae]|uniref:Putative damage-inducible protein DinB n=1 Tax=Longimicrobium terrae TaxID=1639882 RepID=A0A841H714_9BACT|nr:DinB family protein [Longimicrobium terrae]MBB4638262.1 putative damage-inducible protein DinB [Longimicrobium terrae]MBB6073768.1 putative damage-inducible protein DinB [Longimicrobium terrae]NNC30261.1 DinB family protein [Longimicrobium terrae]
MIPRPDASEFLPYYGKYVDRVPGDDALQPLQDQLDEVMSLVRALPEERGGHRYAPGKWSIREVLGHIMDAERIFVYRALRIARGDATPLASFDENAYVPAGRFDARTLADLMEEYVAVRRATVLLFRSMDDDALRSLGVASDAAVSARALAWITAGHERHHLALLRERYLAA